MQIHLLVEDKIRPIPEDVKVLFDWDTVSIITADKNGASGSHMMVEGTPESIKNWLRPFDGVWVGVGAPQLQQFEIKHIK